MKKTMHPISVATNDEGEVLLSQALGDMNYPDPEIKISPDQAALVSSWIQQAALQDCVATGAGPRVISVTFYSSNRGSEAESLEVYVNSAGMIALKINEDTCVQISPTMAKRLREQLSRAITESLTDLLRPDADT